MARSERGGRPCEPAASAAGAELDAAGAARGARGTCRSPGSATPSSRDHPQERGVGDVVVDDEPHVDRERPVGRVDRDGLDVPTDRRLGVVQADLVVAVQGVGGAQAADPATDDRDAHQRVASSRRAARSSSARVHPGRGVAADLRERPDRGTAGRGAAARRGGCPRCSRSTVPVTDALEADVVDGVDAGARADEHDPAGTLEVADPVLHRGDAAAHPDRPGA